MKTEAQEIRSMLTTRIELFEMQIRETLASGETHNCFGVPVDDVIAQWEDVVADTKSELASI